MPPQNPSDSIQETESNKTKHFPELENPFSLESSSESKKSRSDEESPHKSHETVVAARQPESTKPNKTREEEEEKEKGMCAVTVPPKSNGTVEESSSIGRERLKRHRVEVAGRVWIPDMWGQEDFLKDWIDCAAFDASLVNSSIMLARDSLVEEARRANSTRLRIQNGF